MSVQHRWLMWQVVVVGTLTADVLVACLGSPIAIACALACLAAMLALLLTTPPDAIVLPRRRSEMIIAIGVIAFVAMSIGVDGFGRTEAGITGIVASVAALVCARRFHFSPWWSALFAWNPLLFVVIKSS